MSPLFPFVARLLACALLPAFLCMDGSSAAAAPSGAPAGYEGFAILFNNTRNDGGFNESALDGVTRFKTETGVDTREVISHDTAESVAAMRSFAGKGVRNIVVIGFLNEPALRAVAPEFPNVHFTLIDGAVDLPNVRSVLFREDEAAYLAGFAAGLSSRAHHVGFIGAMRIPPIERFACGFVQGVAAAAPSTRVARRYLGDGPAAFRDRRQARAAADALIVDGADVLFAAAGYAGMGALEAAATADKLGIGVDTTQNGAFPGHVLTSVVKRVDVATYRALRDGYDGRWTAGVLRLGLKDDGVSWARDSSNAALVAPIAGTLDATAAAIAAGRIVVKPAAEAPECE